MDVDIEDIIKNNEENWNCGFCNRNKSYCEKNLFCPRTIINRRQPIMVKNEFGHYIKYYNFSDVTTAMEEFAEQMLLKERTETRLILIEKYKL